MSTNPLALLASSDIDWLQIIVFGLAIGASVLGSISKKLIEYFRGRQADKERGAPRPFHEHEREAKLRPVKPTRPMARPFPTTPIHRSTTKPTSDGGTSRQPRIPTAQPTKRAPQPLPQGEELPELLAEIIGFPKPKPRRPIAKKLGPPAAPPRPTRPRSRPEPKPKRANLAARGQLRSDSPGTGSPKQPPLSKRVHQAAHKHHRTKSSAGSSSTKGDLVNLDNVVDMGDSLHASQSAYNHFLEDQAIKPSPSALRRAVILSEILQQPVGLRPDLF